MPGLLHMVTYGYSISVCYIFTTLSYIDRFSVSFLLLVYTKDKAMSMGIFFSEWGFQFFCKFIKG